MGLFEKNRKWIKETVIIFIFSIALEVDMYVVLVIFQMFYVNLVKLKSKSSSGEGWRSGEGQEGQS